MPGTGRLRVIRQVAKRLSQLAQAFPDFRYLELSGPAAVDVQTARAAIAAFVGGASFSCEHIPEEMITKCVYGHELDEALGYHVAVADDVWLAMHLVAEQYQERDRAVEHNAEDAAAPAWSTVREAGIPFILIRTMIMIETELRPGLQEELDKAGVRCVVSATPEDERHVGAVSVRDGCLVFPGEIYALPTEMSADCADDGYQRAVAAASRGELLASHSRFSLFTQMGAFLKSVLSMERFKRQLMTETSDNFADRSEPDLITPSQQATLLGWANPNAAATHKRLAALRKAVIARGMSLEEHLRVKGKGNKTFVRPDQWEDVVTLVRFVAAGVQDESQAIAAIDRGDRLKNSTGERVSYWCDECRRITRTDAPEPVCEQCGTWKRLRPFARGLGK